MLTLCHYYPPPHFYVVTIFRGTHKRDRAAHQCAEARRLRITVLNNLKLSKGRFVAFTTRLLWQWSSDSVQWNFSFYYFKLSPNIHPEGKTQSRTNLTENIYWQEYIHDIFIQIPIISILEFELYISELAVHLYPFVTILLTKAVNVLLPMEDIKLGMWEPNYKDYQLFSRSAIRLTVSNRWSTLKAGQNDILSLSTISLHFIIIHSWILMSHNTKNYMTSLEKFSANNSQLKKNTCCLLILEIRSGKMDSFKLIEKDVRVAERLLTQKLESVDQVQISTEALMTLRKAWLHFFPHT